MFGVANSTVTSIAITWISFLSLEWKFLTAWPTRESIMKYRPASFGKYPKTRVVIDCTEFQVEKPKTPTAQISTWSNYKQRNTFKCLLGISPSGAFTFISKLYGGSISDKEITQRSGILTLLEPGDDVMGDRGFNIRDLLTMIGCTLNIPPYSSGKPLTAAQVIRTRRIAAARIRVERAIERLKNFRIIQHTIPLTLKDTVDQIIQVCASICNLHPPLVK